MDRAFRRCLAPLLLAALAGCLDFDEQELHLAYDAARDQLDVQLVYRGLCSAGTSRWSLFGSSPETEDVEGTERQIDQLLAGRPVFAIFGAMGMYDLVELRESKKGPVAALAHLTTADRGDLFRGEDGRIGGWQHVRLRNVAGAFEIWDSLLQAKLAKEASESSSLRRALGCDDVESAKLWNDALAKKSRWLEEVGAELLLHVPAGESVARSIAARIENARPFEELLAELGASDSSDETAAAASADPRPKPNEPVVRHDADAKADDAEIVTSLLHAIGVSVRVRDGGVDLVLWDAARAPQTLRFKSPPSKHPHYDLAPHLEKRKVALRSDVTDEVLKAAFAEARGR